MPISNIKKTKGVVYTPESIVNLILDFVDYQENILNKKILDPSCGEGAFLISIVERILRKALNNGIEKGKIKKILEENIFGFDIDISAIKKSKKLLNDLVKKYGIDSINWNIKELDCLDKESVSKYFNKFDFVVGNPPYIRIQNLGEKRRKKIQNEWSLCDNGSTDIFIMFFELGFNLLNSKGKLGYITPNTYLKTNTAKKLRIFLKNSGVLKTLINFGSNQLFEKATTYSIITILDKECERKNFSLYYGDKNNIEYIDEIEIKKLNNDNWLTISNKKLSKINNIENRGMPLDKIAQIHVGLTTLADDYYIFKNIEFKKELARIKLKDKREFWIEKDILKPIIKASVLKNKNETQNRFIIFPYKKVDNKNYIIPEKELKERFPKTYNYFLTIKNILDKRDRGKPNPVSWYAFGRSQGLDSSFGKKIITSPMNLKPNFIIWEKEEYTFYAGYCIKFNGNLNWLNKQLNSNDMEFYIKNTSRDYQNNYKSFAKTFIKNFGIQIDNSLKNIKREQKLFSNV
jgi:adenine-specific DNA-methyltransferase